MGNATRPVRRKTVLRTAAPAWVRGPARFDPPGWIVLPKADAEPYRPASPDDLAAVLFDLADVQRPEDARKFVERYGLLRQDREAAARRELAGEYRELWRDWQEEAGNLRRTLSILSALYFREEGDLRSLRELAARYLPEYDAARTATYDVLRWVSEIVGAAVTQELQGVKLILQADVQHRRDGIPGAFGLAVRAETPLAQAYYELSRLFGAQATVLICPNPKCGRYFVARDPRQEYCSPRCNAAHRKQRERERGRRQPDGNPDGNDVSSDANS
jgi:hypothetical protein